MFDEDDNIFSSIAKLFMLAFQLFLVWIIVCWVWHLFTDESGWVVLVMLGIIAFLKYCGEVSNRDND